MARFSTMYIWPDPATGSGQSGIPDLAESLLGLTAQLGFQLVGACPTGLAAASIDRIHDLNFRLVFSWARCGSAAGRGLEITAELLSNEAMAAGAPLSRTCFRAVHAALLNTCPALKLSQVGHGRQRDRSPLDVPLPVSRSANPRVRDRADNELWLDQAA